MKVYLNRADEEIVHAETNHDGVILLDIAPEKLTSISLEISHPHFQSATWSASDDELQTMGEGIAIRVPDMQLERRLTVGLWIATFIFSGVLFLIITEKMHSCGGYFSRPCPFSQRKIM